MHFREAVVVGTAGGSRSGKSVLSAMLAAEMGGRHMSMDDYFLNPKTFPIVHGRPDYERYEAIDWQRAINDIKTFKEGCGILFVEGFMLLADPDVRNLLDLSLFIDTPQSIRTERRFAQEYVKEIDHSYIRHHVPKVHAQIVQPTMQFAHYILDGTLPLDVNRGVIIDYIKEIYDQHRPAKFASLLDVA